MSRMTLPLLTWQEHKVLTTLSVLTWENRAQLYAGAEAFDSLVRRCFIEEHPTSASHRAARYCITEAGRAALREPPSESPRRPRVALLKPRR